MSNCRNKLAVNWRDLELSKEELKVKFVGTDDWDREVYEVLNKKGVHLKQYEGTSGFYVAYGFKGEPDYLLDNNKFNVVIMK